MKMKRKKLQIKERMLETLGQEVQRCFVCGDISFSKGLCKKCYPKVRRKGILSEKKEDIILKINTPIKAKSGKLCYVCEDAYYAKGLCVNCYNKAKRYSLSNKQEIIEKLNILNSKKDRKCYVCGQKAISHGLCAKCLYKAKKFNLLIKGKDEVIQYFLK